MFNPGAGGVGDHFYTIDNNELGQGRIGFQLEGPQGYVYYLPEFGPSVFAPR